MAAITEVETPASSVKHLDEQQPVQDQTGFFADDAPAETDDLGEAKSDKKKVADDNAGWFGAAPDDDDSPNSLGEAKDSSNQGGFFGPAPTEDELGESKHQHDNGGFFGPSN